MKIWKSQKMLGILYRSASSSNDNFGDGDYKSYSEAFSELQLDLPVQDGRVTPSKYYE